MQINKFWWVPIGSVKLQPITSMENVCGLRAMYDLVEENVYKVLCWREWK